MCASVRKKEASAVNRQASAEPCAQCQGHRSSPPNKRPSGGHNNRFGRAVDRTALSKSRRQKRSALALSLSARARTRSISEKVTSSSFLSHSPSGAPRIEQSCGSTKAEQGFEWPDKGDLNNRRRPQTSRSLSEWAKFRGLKETRLSAEQPFYRN